MGVFAVGVFAVGAFAVGVFAVGAFAVGVLLAAQSVGEVVAAATAQHMLRWIVHELPWPVL